MIRALRRHLARPFRARARVAQARGDWAGALSQYQRVARMAGARPALMMHIGNMQSELGRFHDAAENYRMALLDGEVRLRALVALAGLSERKGEWSVAVELWEQVLERMAEEEGTPRASVWPMSPSIAVMHMAKCREVLGDASGAERDFACALVLDPSSRFSREAALMRARMLLKSSRTTAFRFLQRSHRLYVDDPGIALLLLRTATELGSRDEVRTIVRQLAESVRNSPAIESWLSDNGLLVSETIS